MKKILISQCFTGDCCCWNGGTHLIPALRELAERGIAVPVCPEQLGGLPTPRAPSEILGERVVARDGTDVTECFTVGAMKAMAIAWENNCCLAVTKARSPSCGCGQVYDGHFTGTLTNGDGIFVRLLKQAGIPVITEQDDWQKAVSSATGEDLRG